MSKNFDRHCRSPLHTLVPSHDITVSPFSISHREGDCSFTTCVEFADGINRLLFVLGFTTVDLIGIQAFHIAPIAISEFTFKVFPNEFIYS